MQEQFLRLFARPPAVVTAAADAEGDKQRKNDAGRHRPQHEPQGGPQAVPEERIAHGLGVVAQAAVEGVQLGIADFDVGIEDDDDLEDDDLEEEDLDDDEEDDDAELDFNLDSESDNKDKDDIWFPNINKNSQVPN